MNNRGNIELESAIIAACMREESGRRMIALGVKTEYFTDPELRLFYDCIAKLTAAGSSTDLVTVDSQLKIDGKGDHSVRLAEVYAAVPTTAAAETWAASLRGQAGKRKMAALMHHSEAVFDAVKTEDAVSACREFRRKFEAAERLMLPGVRMTQEAQGEFYLKTLDKLQHGSAGGVIVPWGIKGLDSICPLQRGQLFALAAGSNTGKTRFLLSDLAGTLCKNLPAQDAGAYLIFSRENKNRILWDGLISILTGIPGMKLNTRGGCTDAEMDKIGEFVKWLASVGDRFRMFGKGEYVPTPAGIFARVREFEDETGVKASKIAIDYLQNHRPEGKTLSRVEQLENLIMETTVQAAEFDAALLVLSQLNRNKERTGRPGINDVKGTTALECESDYMAFLHNPSPAIRGTVALDFYSLKTRSGVPRWDRKLTFDTLTGYISELEGVISSEDGF